MSVPTPAIWPSFTLADINTTDEWVWGNFFIGYWGEWPGAIGGWFIGADLNGVGGMPRTNIAPGIGYPTGWNDVSVVWGPTSALGIGAYVLTAIPPGACCMPDGSCTLTAMWMCDGYWMGNWSDCGSCPPSLGACCLMNGLCMVTVQAECAEFNGAWQGTGVDCDPSVCLSTSVKGDFPGASPGRLEVAPVPSSGAVTVSYRLAETTPVSLEIFDAAGALVRRITRGSESPGLHQVQWDGRDAAGRGLPVGLYLLRMKTPAGVLTGKAILATR